MKSDRAYASKLGYEKETINNYLSWVWGACLWTLVM